MVKVGETAYLLESNRIVREVIVTKQSGDMCTVKFTDTNGRIKIRQTRLYKSKEEAERAKRI